MQAQSRHQRVLSAFVQAATMPPAFVVLALVGLLLLLMATVFSAAVAMQQLRSIAHTEAEVRAQRVADSLAGRISRALSLGVPLEELVGVPALFGQRMQQTPGMTGLALVDTTERILWLQQPGQAVTERQPIPSNVQQPLPTGLRTVAPVYATAASSPSAWVVVLWQDSGTGSLLGKSLLPLLAWPVAIAALAALVLQRSLHKGRMRRSAILAQAVGNVMSGNFSQSFPVLRRHDFDSRPAWLSAQLRHVNEQHLRITRLHHSLRQTEPDAAQRSALDTALALAGGAQIFQNTENPLALTPPGDVETRRANDTVIEKQRLFGWKWPLRCIVGICIAAGMVLPLLLAFAPQLLRVESWLIDTALVLALLGNIVLLVWIGTSTTQSESSRAS